MLTYKKFLQEARNPKSAAYRYETSTGKVVERADAKVSKVIAVLKEEHTIEAAGRLAKSYIKVENKLKALKSKLEQVKHLIRTDVVDGFFDSVDETLTRVIESTEVSITITKQSKTDDKKVINYEAAIEELIQTNPLLETAITALLDKHSEIKKGSSVASTIKVKVAGDNTPITESMISELISYFKNFANRYLRKFDSKMDSIKKKYLNKTRLAESCEFCAKVDSLIMKRNFSSDFSEAINDALQHYMYKDKDLKSVSNNYFFKVRGTVEPIAIHLFKKGSTSTSIVSCKLTTSGSSVKFECNDDNTFESVEEFIQHSINLTKAFDL